MMIYFEWSKCSKSPYYFLSQSIANSRTLTDLMFYVLVIFIVREVKRINVTKVEVKRKFTVY